MRRTPPPNSFLWKYKKPIHFIQFDTNDDDAHLKKLWVFLVLKCTYKKHSWLLTINIYGKLVNEDDTCCENCVQRKVHCLIDILRWRRMKMKQLQLEFVCLNNMVIMGLWKGALCCWLVLRLVVDFLVQRKKWGGIMSAAKEKEGKKGGKEPTHCTNLLAPPSSF